MKKFAKVFGIIWMIFFGLAAIISIVNQEFRFDNAGSIGFTFGFLIAQVLIISVGYFIYKWGAKK